MTPDWVLPLDELRARIRKILDERESNGWTPTCLGEAMEMECTSVISKSKGGWIFPREQVRMSRAVHLIETGRLIPGKRLTNGGPGNWQVRVKKVPEMTKPKEPPQPKLQIAAKMTRKGPVLQMDKPRIYSHADLYRIR